MFEKLSKPLTILSIIGIISVFTLSSISAADIDTGPGSGPAHAFVPTTNRVTLEAGGQHWYVFHDEGDAGTISIELNVEPDDGATFQVITTEQIRRWVQGEKLVGIGAGTKNDNVSADLFWTGSFVQSGDYYVMVEGQESASNYQLEISGDDVSLSIRTIAPRPDPDILMSDELGLEVETDLYRTASVQGGTGPNDPLPPTGVQMHIRQGQKHWYAFRDEGDGAQIRLALRSRQFTEPALRSLDSGTIAPMAQR